mgnify:CR=1 FL=1
MSDATPALVGLDWGTTSLRAGLLAADGTVIGKRESADGILAAAAGEGFEAVLRRQCAGWLGLGLPVLAGGMIGSRQGWLEGAYLEGRADARAIAAGARRITLSDGGAVTILPGLRRADGIRDVMRGEETQIVGALAEGAAVLPGTHSKWAAVSGGTIERFASFLTGEIFAALTRHTILGKLAEGTEHDDAAFRQGARAGAASTAPTHDVFAARTRVLAGDLAPAGVESWLSGFLIGAEIAGAGRVFGPVSGPLMVIGGAALTARYLAALDELGRVAVAGPSDAAFSGLARVAAAL